MTRKEHDIGDEIPFDPEWTQLTRSNFHETMFKLVSRGRSFTYIPRKGYIYIKQGDVWNHRWIWPDLTWDRLEPFISNGHCYTDVLLVEREEEEVKPKKTSKKLRPKKTSLTLTIK